jgi:superfamily I DNA/RNA helicase
VSPTVLRYKNYRFFFFSREEERLHIHVQTHEGEAKFWLKPDIVLAQNYGLSKKQLGEAEKVIRNNKDEIQNSWRKHFKS